MRYLIVGYVAILMLSDLSGHAKNVCPAILKRPEPSRQTTATHIPSVVQIKGCNFCTGWIAGHNTFVTASHCFDAPSDVITATFIDGITRELHIKRIGDRLKNYGNDIAILIGDDRGFPPLPISRAKESVDMCYSIGYGTNDVQKVTKCFGGSRNPAFPDELYFIGQIWYGDSGGPIVDADTMTVIGMQTALSTKEPTFYAVPAKNILEMLR